MKEREAMKWRVRYENVEKERLEETECLKNEISRLNIKIIGGK